MYEVNSALFAKIAFRVIHSSNVFMLFVLFVLLVMVVMFVVLLLTVTVALVFKPSLSGMPYVIVERNLKEISRNF